MSESGAHDTNESNNQKIALDGMPPHLRNPPLTHNDIITTLAFEDDAAAAASDVAGLTSGTVTTIESLPTMTGPTILIRPRIIIAPRSNTEIDVDHDRSTTDPSPQLLPASLEGGSPRACAFITSAPDPNVAPPEGPTLATLFDTNVPDRSSNNPYPTTSDLVSNGDSSTSFSSVEDRAGSKGMRGPIYKMRTGGRRPRVKAESELP
jgi:hypothetical protein